jgi:S-methylmethionine-dependent homocysteine/selenocysteine methylase
MAWEIKNIKLAELIAEGCPMLLEGALGERLKREYGLKINGIVAMADLLYKKEGRRALLALWGGYRKIAERYNLPFLATTPTRRANFERVSEGGYTGKIIADNVRLLQMIKHGAKVPVFIGGLMGCKGDAYTGEGALGEKAAFSFHLWQAEEFAKAGVDFLYAGIMPVLSEAKGMAAAMAATGLSYIISFTLLPSGRLADGTMLDRAIYEIDNSVIRKPLCYMANCVHPAYVAAALAHGENYTRRVRERFLGVQANTAMLPYEELDNKDKLYTSTPDELAGEMLRLKLDYDLKIFGGCCGTTDAHMDAIARVVH